MMPNRILRQLRVRYLWGSAVGVSYCFLFLLIAAVSVFARFYRIDAVGFDGSDTIYYYSIAREWASGNYVYSIADGINVFRPTVHLIFSLAHQLFGPTDYAIKVVNSTVDVANLMLVVTLGFLVSRRWPVALASGLTYGLLPMAVVLARIELAHVISTFFVLASAVSLLLARQFVNSKLTLVALGTSGMLLAAAVLSHEELVFLCPAFALFLPSFSLWGPRFKQSKQFLLELIALLSPSFIVVATVTLSRPDLLVPLVRNGGVAITSEILATSERFGRFTWDALVVSSSVALAGLFLFAMGFAGRVCIRALARERAIPPVEPGAYLGIAAVCCFLGLYSIFFSTFFARLFLPLMPFVIVSAFTWLDLMLRRYDTKMSGVAVLLVCALAIPFQLGEYWFPQYIGREYANTWVSPRLPTPTTIRGAWRRFRVKYQEHPARTIYDALKDQVSPDARVLVTPSIVYPYAGRRVLQTEAYFGDNAIYVIDHDEPLNELVEKYRIRFILYYRFEWDHRSLSLKQIGPYEYDGKWGAQRSLVHGASYGFRLGEYTLNREITALTDYANSRRGRVLDEFPERLGWILDLLGERERSD
ncbi:MAG: hypothetical protein V3V96_04420 [Acidiferrobacterales bacterium]